MSEFCHPNKYRRRMRMLTRSLIWYKHTSAWLANIEQCSLLFELAHHDKRLVEKLHRPYLHRENNVTQRRAILSNHYELIKKYFSSHQIQKIYFGKGMRLAVSNTGTDSTYELWLRDVGGNDKEGDLGLYWIDSQTQTTLAQLSFSLIVIAELPYIFIGGLQGACDPEARDWIRKATRRCNGLRPKRAVMEGLFAFAKFIQANGIKAVSDRNHVSQSLRVRRNVHASYDEFWREFNATLDEAGDYHLPLVTIKRNPLLIESKKRSEYLRRHERLDNLNTQTFACLQDAESTSKFQRPIGWV